MTLEDPKVILRDPTGSRLMTVNYPEIRWINGDQGGIASDEISGSVKNAKLEVRVNTTDTYIILAQASRGAGT